jgi:hypothetical protein
MKHIIIGLAICLSSCGKPEVPHNIDPYFNSMMIKFQQDAIQHNIGLGDIGKVTVIQFDSSVSDNEYGKCSFKHERGFTYSNYYKVISFSYNLKHLNTATQYKAFLHEIGHCLYNLPHSNNQTNHITEDVMYSIIYQINFITKEVMNQYFNDAINNSSHWYDEEQNSN